VLEASPPRPDVLTENTTAEESTIDLSYYKAEKSRLEDDLKIALDAVREAAQNNDPRAKEEARAKAKEISDAMRALTAELIAKNNGTMPEGWWKK
jgi:hypothetical protein